MSTVRRVAIVHDVRKEVWVNRWSFPRVDGCNGQAETPRDENSPKQIFKALLGHGAVLPGFEDCEGDIIRALEQQVPVKRRPAMHGWHANPRGFVSFLFIAQAPSPISLTLVDNNLSEAAEVRLQGSLAAWQKIVKNVASASTTMLLMLCATFAAPLLTLLDRPSFGLVFFGPSRSGKSSAQLLAASAIGYGREEDLPSLKATDAGLLATAARFNDHMLPINEVASARGSKEEIAGAVRKATYSLMGGHDIVRHPSWNGGDDAKGRSFKVLPVLSSELSPDEWADRSGESRDPGETARLIGIPAVSTGAPTVFDLCTGMQPIEFARKAFPYMRRYLPANRGFAYQAFMQRLARDPLAAAANARAVIERFERQMLRPAMPQIHRDIVAKFGMLAAGGLLAIDSRVLPFTKELILAAVTRGCRAAIASLPDHDVTLRRDIATLRQAIDRLPRKGALSQRGRGDAPKPTGYVESMGVSGMRVVIRTTALQTLLPNKARLLNLLERCDDDGLLSRGKARSAGRSIEWAEKQIVWPDRTRPRAFVLDLPHGLNDLDRLLADK